MSVIMTFMINVRKYTNCYIEVVSKIGYKQLIDIEDAFRTIKSDLKMIPMYQRREGEALAHVELCWLDCILVKII